MSYPAVLLAGVGSMGLGFLWYGPILGRQWMKEKGYTKEALKTAQAGMGKLYLVSFLVALVTAFVLSRVVAVWSYYWADPKLLAGLSAAFWMWLGFIMPVQATATVFGGRNWKLLAIDTGYQLVSVLVMGLVIGLF